MLKKSLLSTLLFFSLSTLQAQSVNSNESRVDFTVKNMAFNRVEGNFSGIEGMVNFSPKDLSNSSINICIDANTINTENKDRDTHLKNEDFFEVETYPTICFEADKFEKINEQFFTIGKLTMHGITKTVKIPFTYEDRHIKAVFKVLRKDYNIGENTGNFMVGNEIDIHIICSLN